MKKQTQVLAHSLVKTILRARDAQKPLSPALSTAWALLVEQFSQAESILLEEIKWESKYEEDIQMIVNGVARQFSSDASLHAEFVSFMAEVNPYEEQYDNALPLVLTLSTSNAKPSPANKNTASGPSESSPLMPIGVSTSLESPKQKFVAPANGPKPKVRKARTGLFVFAATAILLGSGFVLWNNGTFKTADLASGTTSLKEKSAHALAKANDGVLIEELPVEELRATATDKEEISAQTNDHRSSSEHIVDEKALINQTNYFATQNNIVAAIATQKAYLSSLKKRDRSSLLIGRAHLKLAYFYEANEEFLMARAHLQQARHLFGQTQDLIDPELIEASKRIDDRLVNRS